MKSLIVVDDFYGAPLKVRDAALRAEFDDVRSLNYPGSQSVRTFASSAVKGAFEKLVGQALDIDESKLTFGRFRVMTSGPDTRLKIHADGGADWTGLVYLNLPTQCKGGTSFYRHKATALEGPPTDADAERLGYKSAMELETDLIAEDSLDSSAWVQTMFVGMRFNRLILFRGSRLFHSHTCSWGGNLQDGRLTQNFFFNVASSRADEVLKA